MDESKIKAIRQWQKPRNITDVWSFHRLGAFYRRFIPHFSSIMAPVTKCMKSGQFHWTEEAEEAFELIKTRLTTASILVLPNFSQYFELHCDALKVGIRAILCQQGRPVAYFSESYQDLKHSIELMMWSFMRWCRQYDIGAIIFSIGSLSSILIMML